MAPLGHTESVRHNVGPVGHTESVRHDVGPMGHTECVTQRGACETQSTVVRWEKTQAIII